MYADLPLLRKKKKSTPDVPREILVRNLVTLLQEEVICNAFTMLVSNVLCLVMLMLKIQMKISVKLPFDLRIIIKHVVFTYV